jgi:hypothetical protein
VNLNRVPTRRRPPAARLGGRRSEETRVEDYAVGADAGTAELARSWMYWAMTAVALR